MAKKTHRPSTTVLQARAEPNQAEQGLERLKKSALEKLGVKYNPLLEKFDTNSLDKTREALLKASFAIFFNSVKHDLAPLLTEESLDHYRTYKNTPLDQEDARYALKGRLWKLTDTLCDIQLKYMLGIDSDVTRETLEKNIDLTRDSIESLFEETDASRIRNVLHLQSQVVPHFDKRVFAAKCVTASREAVVTAISNQISRSEPSI